MKRKMPLTDLAVTETDIDSLDECLVFWGLTRTGGMTLGELHAARYILADKYELNLDMHSVSYFTGNYTGYTFGLSTSRHDKARIGAYMLDGLTDTLFETAWKGYLGRVNAKVKPISMFKNVGGKNVVNNDFSVTFADGVIVTVDSGTEWGYAAIDGAASGYTYEEFVSVFGPDPNNTTVLTPTAYIEPPEGGTPQTPAPVKAGMSPITMALIGLGVFFVVKRFGG